MAVAFDTNAAVRRLRDAGVDERQAEAHIEVVKAAISEGVATKADIAAVKADIAAVKTDLAEQKADIYRALWMQAGVIVAAVVALMKLLP